MAPLQMSIDNKYLVCIPRDKVLTPWEIRFRARAERSGGASGSNEPVVTLSSIEYSRSLSIVMISIDIVLFINLFHCRVRMLRFTRGDPVWVLESSRRACVLLCPNSGGEFRWGKLRCHA